MSQVLGEAFVRVRPLTGGLVEQVSAEGSRAGRAFSAAFNRSSKGTFGTVSKEIEQTTRGAAAGSGVFSHLGRSLAFASTTFLGTASAVKLFRDSIDEATDAQKQLERANSLFVASAKDVKKFAEQAAGAIGMSNDEALKFANDLGQMLVPLGIAPKRASEMSIELTKLAANLAAMRNEDPTTVLAKLEAGLRGRGMGLKAYGIDVSTVTLKEEALRIGLVKQAVDSQKVQLARDKLAIATANLSQAQKDYLPGTTQVAGAQDAVTRAQSALNKALAGGVPALTQQQKSLAAVNIILHQGSRYQDEYAKHSGDLANQQRRLHAEISNLEEGIGRALIPMVNRAVGGMADWLAVSKNSERVQRDVIGAVHTLAGVLSGAWTVFQTGVAVIRPVVNAVGGLKKAIELLIALKLGLWVTGSVLPALSKMRVGWLGVGTAATTAATETTVATKVIQTDMGRLNTAGGINTVRTGMKGIGNDAQTSSGKVSTLGTRLGRLKGVGPIGIAIGLAMSVTDTNGNPLSQSLQAGILGTIFTGNPLVGGVAAAAVGAFNLGKWAGGKVFGKGVNPATDDVTTTIDMKPAAFIHAPEGGTVVSIGHSGTVATSKGGFQNRQFVYQLVFVGDSGASYTFNNVIPVSHEGGQYPKNAVIAKAPPGGKVKFHYAHPTDARIPSGTADTGGYPLSAQGKLVGTPGQGTHSRSERGYIWQDDDAVDIEMSASTKVVAVEDGVLTGSHYGGDSGRFSGWGLTLLADSGSSYFYKHMKTIIFKPSYSERVRVKKGQVIGMGTTTGHLHFAKKGAQTVAQVLSASTTPTGSSGGASASGGSAPAAAADTPVTLTVGQNAKTTAARKDIVGPALANDLAAAQRAVTRAGPKGGSALEDAIRAEMAVDDKIIAAAQKYLAKHPKMKATVQAIINSAKQDQASLTVQLANLRKREESAYRKGQVHEGLVKQIVEGLGLSDSALATRAAEAAGAKYEGLADTVLRRILAAQKRARATLKAEMAKGATADVAQQDILGTLLGMDPDTMFTETDKWGRQINMSIGQVIADVQKASRDLQEAMASGNKAAIQAAINEWTSLGPEIQQAVQTQMGAAQSAFSSTMSALDNQILTSFDRVTQSHLQQMQRDFQAQVEGMNRGLDQQIQAMQRTLQTRILAVQQAGAAATPAEAQLAALQAGHDKAARDKQMAAAVAAHDQDAINEILYQDRVASLQKIAATERAARDKDTADKVQKMQDDEALLEQGLRDNLAAQIQAMQDAETAREQDYQDQRDAQRNHLATQLDDWNKHLADGSASWADFMAWLNGEVTSGVLPGLPNVNPVTLMAEAGSKQGSAFADEFIAELQRAYQAYLDLLAGRKPGGSEGGPADPSRPPDVGDAADAAGAKPGGSGGSHGSPTPPVPDGSQAAADGHTRRALAAQNLTLDRVANILVASLNEHKKQSDLLADGPAVVVVDSRMDANKIALKAAR